MAQRFDIVHIQFQANAAKANAALDSMRASAKACRDEHTRLKQQYEAGVAANLPTAQLDALASKMRKVAAEERQWTAAINSAVKGVAVLDQAILAFNNGTLEQMNVQLSKTARNAAQLQMNRATVGTRDWQEMKVLIEELDKNILKGTNDLKAMQEMLKGGGVVAYKNLREAETALKGLMEATTRGTQEWKGYQAILKDVQAAMTRSSELEKQLRGEIVTVADAQRVLAATDKKTAEQMAADAEAEARMQHNRLKMFNLIIADYEKMIAVEQQSVLKIDEEAAAVAKDIALLREEADAKKSTADANKKLSEAEKELARLRKDEPNETAKIAAQENLVTEAKKRVTDATTRQTAAEKAAANARKNGALADQEKRLDALNTKRQAHIATITTEEQEIARLGQRAIEAGDKQALAEQHAQQARGLTKEQIEQTIQVLRKQQQTADAATYAKTEKDIQRLMQKLDELTGKTMSYANAMKMSQTAGTGAFKGTAADLQKAQQALEQSLATTDKGTVKYQRLQQALARVKAEMSGAGITSQRMQEILANPKAEKSVDVLKNAVGRARSELDVMGQRIERMQRLLAQAEKNGNVRWANRLRDSIKQTTKSYDDMAAATKRADQAQKELANTAKGTASAFDKAWSRLKTYIGLYMGAAVAIRQLMGTLGDLAELSDKMGEVRKTTGFTADEVGRLVTNLKKMDVRTPVVELTELAASAGQLGLKTLDDVQGFTEAANKLMIALPEMGKEAATEMMRVAIATGEVDKIRKQMQEGIIDGSSATAVAMEKIASTIDRLRATSASTAPEITDFVKRVGAVGAQSGITIDQVSALGSTISSLGLRIEMSATALSRMIPAIRNNAFDIAHSIGVTPETIRNLFDTGRGMEAILMILQHMKDANMDAESIEAMMGMGGMVDVMKDLNQQGARAGIVFAGLSQNVGELRRQLGVASEAYEENIAVQQEFEKMNETTAAKWERLKNRIEEFFIGDSAQRWLGNIIDGLRWIVDFLMGPMSSAFKSLLTGASFYFLGVGGLIYKGIINPMILAATGVHSFKTQIMGMAATWRRAWRSMDAATKATWIGAITAAVYMLGKAIWDYATKVNELDKSLARLDNEEAEAERNLNHLMNSFTTASKKTEEAKKKQEELEEETKSLREEVEKLRGSKDKSTEATDRLNKKEEELKQKEKDLKKATEESNKANNERLTLIKEINSKYSSYLGYLLDEKTAAEQVALAHWQIVDALKEELEQKRLGKKQEAIDQEMGEGIDRAGARSKASLSALPADMQRRITSQMNTVRGRIQFAYDDKGNAVFRLPQMEGLNANEVTKGSYEELRPYIQKVFANVVKNEVREAQKVMGRDGKPIQLDFGTRQVFNGYNPIGDVQFKTVSNTVDDFIRQSFTQFDNWTQQTLKREERIAEAREEASSVKKGARANSVADADKMNADAYKRITATLGKLGDNQKLSTDNIGNLAQQANIITANLTKFKGELKNADKFIGKDNEVSLENAVNTMYATLSEAQRKQIITAAKRQQQSGGGSDTSGGGGGNRWGEKQPAESTNYRDMNAEQLVNRRQQMNKFVNAIQTDTDVQSVLKEDAALKKAIEKGMSSDMRTVIEWYNTERLKIQDELHARHLTNTGDWLDPKKERARKKRLQEEWKYYLDELDAYYTERKSRIQEAGNEEGVTQAEVQSRTLANEAEWHQRRAELQALYADKSVEVTQQEQDAIYSIIAERTGDDADFVMKTIGKTVGFMKKIGEKSPTEYRKALGILDKGMEKDFLQQQQAIARQMQAIQDIIDKERPFNGITKNLRENLATMGILTADMTRERDRLMAAGEDMADFNARQAAEEVRRTAFMLGEAENAYSATVEDVMRRMADKGMTAWADELRRNPKMQEGLMAQLRSTYDAIQDAIKKEASLIKKQVEIQWNDALTPDGKSMKQAFEGTLSALGLREDQVKRANSLISAGRASERVADRIAVKQMQIRLQMQETYYKMLRKIGMERIAQLEAAGKHEDAEHVRKSLNLALSEEQKKLDEQRVAIANQLEESQNRLYQELREWGDLMASSVQQLFEASNAGNAEYYNERAKMNLTGRGGPGAGTYIVIDNEGTSDARAHYEYLDERQALERHREIEQQNAVADAWKKVMDDINQKMSDMITDQINAMLQNDSIDANTDALGANTLAIQALSNVITGMGMGGAEEPAGLAGTAEGSTPGVSPAAPEGLTTEQVQEWKDALGDNPMLFWQEQSDAATQKMLANMGEIQKGQQEAGESMAASAQSTFAKMSLAANMYGVAYQAMTNSNLSTTQKFEMMALQAVGNYAISSLTAFMAKTAAEGVANEASVLGKLWSQLGWAAAPVFAIFTGLLGAAMGAATNAVSKSKSQIAQATGSSVGAGRLATGMLTYGEGNVNEFTDPASLTPGRHYNVDGADGRTYRARYMGKDARTHITSGPEFHLVGEKGREAIIDAHTTRNIQLNEPEIWNTIQTLYNGGSLAARRRRAARRGVRAFADGNIDEFTETDGLTGTDGAGETALGFDPAALQASLDRNSAVQEALLERLAKPLTVSPYGPDGIVAAYDKYKKEALRHGEEYI